MGTGTLSFELVTAGADAAPSSPVREGQTRGPAAPRIRPHWMQARGCSGRVGCEVGQRAGSAECAPLHCRLLGSLGGQTRWTGLAPPGLFLYPHLISLPGTAAWIFVQTSLNHTSSSSQSAAHLGWTWWHKLVTLGLRGLRQEDS